MLLTQQDVTQMTAAAEMSRPMAFGLYLWRCDTGHALEQMCPHQPLNQNGHFQNSPDLAWPVSQHWKERDRGLSLDL